MIGKWRFLAATLLVLFQLSRPATCATFGFKPAVIYPVGTAPASVATGDFNNDGKPDLAVANSGDPTANDNGSVSILLGNTGGTFQAAVSIAAGKNPSFTTVGDFNQDGNVDLATVNSDNTVSVLLGIGDGTFQTHVDYAAGNGAVSLAVGDFNGDSHPDLVVANATDGTLGVLFGNGDGTFQPHLDYATGGTPSGLVVADFNGDGKEDLAVGILQTGVEILLGKGDGSFTLAGTYGQSGGDTPVALGDFTSDGKPDLLVSGGSSSGNYHTVYLLLANGDGTFQAGNAIEALFDFDRSPLLADFDGDGKLDLATHHSRCVDNCIDEGLVVLPGNGDGTFSAAVNIASGSAYPDPLLAADLDGDKAPDVVISNNGQPNTIIVLLNTGTAFSISASAPEPGTVSRGQSATSTISLSLLNAFDNPVALTCWVQPVQSATTCSLDQNSVTFDANGNATAMLTINTGTANASLGHSRAFQFLWLPVAGFALMGAGFGSRRSTRRKLAACLLGGILFGGLIFQAACGGGSAASNRHHSATYTITVTGTAGSTQHSTAVTLTVQ